MGDDRLRGAERAWREAGDDESEVRYLRELLRVGRVERQALRLAALLGHAPARAALDEPAEEEQPELAAWVARLAAALLEAGPDAPLRAAVACARSVPVYGDRFDGPEDDSMRGLEALDALALVEPAARAGAASKLREDLAQHGGGYHVGNVAYEATTLVLEPENAATLLPGLLLRVLEGVGRDARVELREELSPWLLGLTDPLRERAWGQRFGADREIVRGVAFTPDGRLVATGNFRGDVVLREAAGGALVQVLEAQRRRDLVGVAISPDGASLLTGDIDGRLVVWDVPSRAVRAQWHAGVEDGATDVAFLPDGRVVGCGRDGALRVWSPDGSQGLVVAGPEAKQRALAVAPDGGLVATAAQDRLTLWDLTAEGTRWSVEHPREASDVAWSGDGEHVVTLGDDGRLRRFLAATGELVDESLVHPRSGYALAVAGDLAATVHDRAVVLTRLSDGVVVRRARAPGVQLAVGFAPDGAWFLVGARSGALRRYDV